MSWAARAVLIVAGLMAGWLVAKDATNFGFIQMTIAILLCMLVVFVLAFWPASWTARLTRPRKPPPA